MEQSFGIVPFYKREGQFVFLLIRHQAGHWAFPKGHARSGEPDLQAAKREFEEETGIREYEVQSEVSFIERYLVPRGSNPGSPKEVKYFLASVKNPDVKIQESDIADHRWLSFEDAKRQMTFDEGREVLEAARQHLDARGDRYASS